MLIVSQERSVMEEGKKNLDRWNGEVGQWLHETIYYRSMEGKWKKGKRECGRGGEKEEGCEDEGREERVGGEEGRGERGKGCDERRQERGEEKREGAV